MKREIVDIEGSKGLRFKSISSSNCMDINLPYFSQKTGYLVKVQSKNIQGKSLLFSINNHTSKNNIIETYLSDKTRFSSSLQGAERLKDKSGFSELGTSYFIIPPMEEYGAGYSLHFDNISIGRQKTINDLGRVEVYPIPYNFLKGIKFLNIPRLLDYSTSEVGYSRNLGIKEDFQVSHPNPSFYKITINQLVPPEEELRYLVLSQSYHPGWIAFQIKNEKLKIKNWTITIPKFKKLADHVLINNWQNGWRLDKNNLGQLEIRSIYIFFWPQLLEYLGFGLLGLALVYATLKK